MIAAVSDDQKSAPLMHDDDVRPNERRRDGCDRSAADNARALAAEIGATAGSFDGRAPDDDLRLDVRRPWRAPVGTEVGGSVTRVRSNLMRPPLVDDDRLVRLAGRRRKRLHIRDVGTAPLIRSERTSLPNNDWAYPDERSRQNNGSAKNEPLMPGTCDLGYAAVLAYLDSVANKGRWRRSRNRPQDDPFVSAPGCKRYTPILLYRDIVADKRGGSRNRWRTDDSRRTVSMCANDRRTPRGPHDNNRNGYRYNGAGG